MILIIVIQLKISDDLSSICSHLIFGAGRLSVTVALHYLILQRWRLGSASVAFVQSGSSKFAKIILCEHSNQEQLS